MYIQLISILSNSCIFRVHSIPDVPFEWKHVFVLDKDGRRSCRGNEWKEILEVGKLWRGAFQVQMNHTTSGYVPGSRMLGVWTISTLGKFISGSICLEKLHLAPTPHLVPSGLESGRSESGMGSILDMSISVPPPSGATFLLLGMKFT